MNFEGPFDLLLQLISKHKLDVTEVALSRVTDEFMAHIRAMGAGLGPRPDHRVPGRRGHPARSQGRPAAARRRGRGRGRPGAPRSAGPAVRPAAPVPRVQADRRDLPAPASTTRRRRYPRTVGLEPHHAELLPEVVISIGAEGFARLAVKAMQPKPKPQVYVDHIHAPLVSVREQAEIVVARLREHGEATFRELDRGHRRHPHRRRPVPGPAGALPGEGRRPRPGGGARRTRGRAGRAAMPSPP